MQTAAFFFFKALRSSSNSIFSTSSKKHMAIHKNKYKLILNTGTVIAVLIATYQFYNVIVNLIDNNNEIYSHKDLVSPVVLTISTLLMRKISEDIENHINSFQVLFRRAVSNANLKETVTYIGTSSEALKYIKKDILKASSVTNTYLAVLSSTSEYGSIYQPFFESKYSKRWRDLVGLPDLFGGRYRSITLPKSGAKTLELNILRHSPPIVNFIQIKVGSKTKTYFGWVGFDDNESDIFVTEQSQLNALFENQYEKAFSAYKLPGEDSKFEITSGNVETAISNQTSIVDKAGYWLTAEWAIGSRKEPYIVSYGLIHIEFKNSRLEILPAIFDVDFMRKEDTKHIDAVKNYNDKLYFDFGYVTDDKQSVSGMCSYEFKKGTPNTLTGHLYQHDNWELNKLTGVRLNKRTFEAALKKPTLIKRHRQKIPTIDET